MCDTGHEPRWALEHIRADQATFRAEIESAGFALVACPSMDEFGGELAENYVMVFVPMSEGSRCSSRE